MKTSPVSCSLEAAIDFVPLGLSSSVTTHCLRQRLSLRERKRPSRYEKVNTIPNNTRLRCASLKIHPNPLPAPSRKFSDHFLSEDSLHLACAVTRQHFPKLAKKAMHAGHPKVRHLRPATGCGRCSDEIRPQKQSSRTAESSVAFIKTPPEPRSCWQRTEEEDPWLQSSLPSPS